VVAAAADRTPNCLTGISTTPRAPFRT